MVKQGKETEGLLRFNLSPHLQEANYVMTCIHQMMLTARKMSIKVPMVDAITVAILMELWPLMAAAKKSSLPLASGLMLRLKLVPTLF